MSVVGLGAEMKLRMVVASAGVSVRFSRVMRAARSMAWVRDSPDFMGVRRALRLNVEF